MILIDIETLYDALIQKEKNALNNLILTAAVFHLKAAVKEQESFKM